MGTGATTDLCALFTSIRDEVQIPVELLLGSGCGVFLKRDAVDYFRCCLGVYNYNRGWKERSHHQHANVVGCEIRAELFGNYVQGDMTLETDQ